MADLVLHLRIAGLAQILLGLLHAFFPKRFHWHEELPRLSLLNRQMFVVHAFFIALTVALFGLLSLAYADVLVQPGPLQRPVAAGLSIFWGCRLVMQFVVYDRRLWAGHRFNTLMHVLFSAFWIYLTTVYLWTALAPAWPGRS